MRVIPVEEPAGAVNRAANPRRFWQRLACALDAYFVDRSRRAVSAAMLRRSKHEADRCRRLMHKSPVMAAAASVDGRRFVRR